MATPTITYVSLPSGDALNFTTDEQITFSATISFTGVSQATTFNLSIEKSTDGGAIWGPDDDEEGNDNFNNFDEPISEDTEKTYEFSNLNNATIEDDGALYRIITTINGDTNNKNESTSFAVSVTSGGGSDPLNPVQEDPTSPSLTYDIIPSGAALEFDITDTLTFSTEITFTNIDTVNGTNIDLYIQKSTDNGNTWNNDNDFNNNTETINDNITKTYTFTSSIPATADDDNNLYRINGTIDALTETSSSSFTISVSFPSFTYNSIPSGTALEFDVGDTLTFSTTIGFSNLIAESIINLNIYKYLDGVWIEDSSFGSVSDGTITTGVTSKTYTFTNGTATIDDNGNQYRINGSLNVGTFTLNSTSFTITVSIPTVVNNTTTTTTTPSITVESTVRNALSNRNIFNEIHESIDISQRLRSEGKRFFYKYRPLSGNKPSKIYNDVTITHINNIAVNLPINPEDLPTPNEYGFDETDKEFAKELKLQTFHRNLYEQIDIIKQNYKEGRISYHISILPSWYQPSVKERIKVYGPLDIISLHNSTIS